ncbi:hypothetical protein LMG27177_07146 [Paraburkholderia fynbosensis]|uniref:Uncharacterized protein n=1 Tax=Paraburkholderia fynbosensis TaxID=1200993 RepID=A0A6J5H162_9BURK|nr:hypothetical protein LMG27177_07146 [Paraburkholderia fynbosensis]
MSGLAAPQFAGCFRGFSCIEQQAPFRNGENLLVAQVEPAQPVDHALFGEHTMNSSAAGNEERVEIARVTA